MKSEYLSWSCGKVGYPLIFVVDMITGYLKEIILITRYDVGKL